MKINTSRFGVLDIDDKKIITLKRGLLGFPDARRFALFPHGSKSPFYWMQSVEDENLAFVVIHPSVFCADYSFDVPDKVVEDLEIKDPGEIDLFVIVTIHKSSSVKEKTRVSANLLGPVVINSSNMTGMQIVLDPGKYPVQFDIPLK